MPSKREPGKRRGRPAGRRSAEISWRDRLVLNPGETLGQVQRNTTGNQVDTLARTVGFGRQRDR
jgi:hypothetical protein